MSPALSLFDCPGNLLSPSASTFRAPARFDTHAVGSFEQWVVENDDDHLVVDLAAVVFMDLDAVEALVAIDQRRAGHGGSLRIDNPSAAASITLEMLGLGSSQFAMAA